MIGDSFLFQHTAARRRLAQKEPKTRGAPRFNTQPPEGGWTKNYPKTAPTIRFNTQPPEGGWGVSTPDCGCIGCFNTQPPEGGWDVQKWLRKFNGVSTHSRPKAAGLMLPSAVEVRNWFQHTAARRRLGFALCCSLKRNRSFNTQPPEGGWILFSNSSRVESCFNTQPPEGGWLL